MEGQAAAIAIGGAQFVVVAVGMELIDNTGEADMAIDTLVPKFGGAPVVLMAQREDGTPRYYGDANHVESLRGVPVAEMPWKSYNV